MELDTALKQARTINRTPPFVQSARGIRQLENLITDLKKTYANALIKDIVGTPEKDPDWHRGEPCKYDVTRICIEGWCRNCDVANRQESIKEMKSGNYWDCMEDRRDTQW